MADLNEDKIYKQLKEAMNGGEYEDLLSKQKSENAVKDLVSDIERAIKTAEKIVLRIQNNEQITDRRYVSGYAKASEDIVSEMRRILDRFKENY